MGVRNQMPPRFKCQLADPLSPDHPLKNPYKNPTPPATFPITDDITFLSNKRNKGNGRDNLIRGGGSDNFKSQSWLF